MKNNNQIVEAMKLSRGRFFGLSTKQGETLNAQFVKETPFYVVIKDRNAQRVRKFAKTSLKNVSINGLLV